MSHTQPPLFGEPDPEPTPEVEEGPVVMRHYSGKSHTCHLCILDRAHGTVTLPLDTTRYIAVKGGKEVSLCRAHAGQITRGERSL